MSARALREVLEHEPPLIAVAFGDSTPPGDIGRLRDAGLDVAELRIDRYRSFDVQHVLDQVETFSTLPTIATIRTPGEGGRWQGAEAARLRLFEAVLPHVHAVDVELASSEILSDVVGAAQTERKVMIVSIHDFERTPTVSELADLASEAKEAGADYVKFAVTARSSDDLRTLARFTLANAGLGLIVMAMGEYGPASRVLLPALGSRLTFASQSGLTDVADGQLPFAETLDLMRTLYPEINDRKNG